MLTLKKLTKSVGGRTLFEDVSMTINYGERAALVGPNGSGKSTLFSLILHADTPDRGSIVRDEWTTLGYLPQESEPIEDENALQIAMGQAGELDRLESVLRSHEEAGTTDSNVYFEAQTQFDALSDPSVEAKAKTILRGLGYREHDWVRPAKELSGGWIMRAHLARLLVLEPELLMLDEPTNHLDLMSLLWFQKHLQTYSGAILMISHDREFMDAIVETVYDIDEKKLIQYKGNYSDCERQRRENFERQHAAFKNQQKEIKSLQVFADKFRSVASKAAQAQSKLKQIERMELIEKPRQPRKVFRIQFPQPTRSGQRVISLESIDMGYGDTMVYKGLDLVIERGERIVLVGPNGAGKSTLMKILAGVTPFQKGERNLGHNCRIGYFSQHRSEQLDENNTVLEEVMGTNPEIREEDARGVLGSFLFRKEDVFKKTGVLSGGEKSRLNLIKFLVDPPNLLLMDEPTTHLDITSIEALIIALQRYEGTLVFISHDVHFIRSLATKVLHISAGEVSTYSGDYDYYLEKTGAIDQARAAVTAGGPLTNEQVR